MGVLFIVVAFSLLVGVVLIAYRSVIKNDLGINPDPVVCPRCNASRDSKRSLALRWRALWGGWTCPNCGCEVDKAGREAAAAKVAFKVALRTSLRDRQSMTFTRRLRRNFLIVAPALYVVEVLSGAAPSLRDRLLRPIMNVILSTFVFTASQVGLRRIFGRLQPEKSSSPVADDGNRSGR